MQTEQLLDLVQDALDDLKAKDIVVLDVRGKSSVTDYMVIASGTSKRHAASCADHVIERVKKSGLLPMGVEGAEASEWILADLGEVVVHVMVPEAREFYDLERLWSFDQAEDA